MPLQDVAEDTSCYWTTLYSMQLTTLHTIQVVNSLLNVSEVQTSVNSSMEVTIWSQQTTGRTTTTQTMPVSSATALSSLNLFVVLTFVWSTSLENLMPQLTSKSRLLSLKLLRAKVSQIKSPATIQLTTLVSIT